MAHGLSYKQVARRLGVSVGAVSSLCSRAYSKSGVTNAREWKASIKNIVDDTLTTDNLASKGEPTR